MERAVKGAGCGQSQIVISIKTKDFMGGKSIFA
jgi:hypothetical protein